MPQISCYSDEQLFNIFSILWEELVSSHMTRRLFKFPFQKGQENYQSESKSLEVPTSSFIFPMVSLFSVSQLRWAWILTIYRKVKGVLYWESWRRKATAHWKSTGQETSSDRGSWEAVEGRNESTSAMQKQRHKSWLLNNHRNWGENHSFFIHTPSTWPPRRPSQFTMTLFTITVTRTTQHRALLNLGAQVLLELSISKASWSSKMQTSHSWLGDRMSNCEKRNSCLLMNTHTYTRTHLVYKEIYYKAKIFCQLLSSRLITFFLNLEKEEETQRTVSFHHKTHP